MLAEWPLVGLGVTIGPGGGATLRHRRHPGRLVVDDAAALGELRRAAPRTWRGVLGWKAALASGLAVLAVLALLIDAAPDLVAPIIPGSWDQALGRMAETATLSGHRRCMDVAGQAALQGFVTRLGQGAGLGRPVRIVVSDDDTANAFALPGDRIVLPRGMIAAVADVDELAGVLAHEMGHVVHRDSLRGAVRSAGLQVAAAALGWGGFSSAQVVGDLTGLSFSRAAETEADAFAVSSLRQAGLRADGLGRFLAQAGHGLDLPAFLSDHPASAERQARATAGPEGDPAFGEAEWRAIRSMCHGADAPQG